MEELEKRFFIFPQVEVNIENFESEGYILDIGGGGEGVIGQLKGPDVIAIDIRLEELEEAPPGPLKIVMDARTLLFLDCSFSTVTSFFTLMYVREWEEKAKILAEVSRVLKPGGRFILWEVDLSDIPQTDKEFYLVQLSYKIGNEIKATGYGSRWPDEPRGPSDYVALANKFGLQQNTFRRRQHTFYTELIKS